MLKVAHGLTDLVGDFNFRYWHKWHRIFTKNVSHQCPDLQPITSTPKLSYLGVCGYTFFNENFGYRKGRKRGNGLAERHQNG